MQLGSMDFRFRICRLLYLSEFPGVTKQWQRALRHLGVRGSEDVSLPSRTPPPISRAITDWPINWLVLLRRGRSARCSRAALYLDRHSGGNLWTYFSHVSQREMIQRVAEVSMKWVRRPVADSAGCAHAVVFISFVTPSGLRPCL